MKQPHLGRKILELRQEKGLTQEELVEQCNISVRTIQRIEAGEVTPRSYTVKTILDALDYDLSSLKAAAEHPAKTEIKELLLLDVEDSKEANYLVQHLHIAWIAGIIYFIVTIPEMYADFMLFSEDVNVFSTPIYVVLKLLVMACAIFFYRGLTLVGKIFQNYLLKIGALLLLILSVSFYLGDIIAIYLDTVDYTYYIITECISFGIISVFFAIGLIRLHAPLKNLGLAAGIIELIVAATYLTIILSIIGLILWSVALIIEIIILFKTVELMKKKMKQMV